MLEAIRLIKEFIGSMDLEAYAADRKTKAAVERELQIITEAAYRLQPEGEILCPEPDWMAYRGMATSSPQLPQGGRDYWNTVKSDLPALKQAVTRAVAKLPAESQPIL